MTAVRRSSEESFRARPSSGVLKTSAMSPLHQVDDIGPITFRHLCTVSTSMPWRARRRAFVATRLKPISLSRLAIEAARACPGSSPRGRPCRTSGAASRRRAATDVGVRKSRSIPMTRRSTSSPTEPASRRELDEREHRLLTAMCRLALLGQTQVTQRLPEHHLWRAASGTRWLPDRGGADARGLPRTACTF